MQASRQEIIMNFSTPPSDEDLMVLARECVENMPDEFAAFCKDLDVAVEDFVDEHTESQLETDDAYEVLLYIKSGKEISPGIESVSSANNDTLLLYRRAIIDYWAETQEDLADLVTRIIFEEIAAEHDYTAEEIAEMVNTHLQS
jgi:predicted Zn-dependent protease with MMP-like domain